MKLLGYLAVLLFAFTICTAEVFFSEEFNDGWEQRWVNSKSKGESAGQFVVSAGKYFTDEASEKGLQTSQDARFYQTSAEFKEFSNKGKTLVLQYSVKHEQNIDCGGGYVKILPAGIDQENFNGDSPYNVMFGPDICGATKKVHFIIGYKGKNHLIKSDVRAESDELTHLYTLILNPDQSFQILIDNKEVKKGTLLDSFDILPPKEINDPSVSKPLDWVDNKEIVDPEAKKPEDWDTIEATIKDPEAQQPEDWDAELDGEWEAPTIPNPEYKGEWKAPKIPNPEYKGEWVHPKIPNPEYYEDNEIYAFESNKFIGIEIWQVKSGTIFDNFLITDDVEVAKEWAEKSLKRVAGEKELKEKADEERRAKAKAEAPAGEEPTGDDDSGADDLSDLDLGGDNDDDNDAEAPESDHDEL
jgi:calreticulin